MAAARVLATWQGLMPLRNIAKKSQTLDPMQIYGHIRIRLSSMVARLKIRTLQRLDRRQAMAADYFFNGQNYGDSFMTRFFYLAKCTNRFYTYLRTKVDFTQMTPSEVEEAKTILNRVRLRPAKYRK